MDKLSRLDSPHLLEFSNVYSRTDLERDNRKLSGTEMA